MVKNIIQRIIVGVGIALALMFIKGGLITTVQAKNISSAFTNQDIAKQCDNCSNLDTSLNNSWVNWEMGTLYFNVGIADSTLVQPQWNWSLVLGNAYVIASGQRYTCQVGTASNPKSVNVGPTSGVQATNNDTLLTAVYSVSCRVKPGPSGIQAIYLRGMGNSGTATMILYAPITFEEDGEQAIQNAVNQNTQATNNVNNSINDSTTDDPSSDISTMNSKVASNNSITQLLTLPIQLYQSILNSLSGSCSSFSLGTLYNHSITLPCIDLESLLGSTLYGIIDILISGLFVLSFRKKMVDIFNHMTSLNDRGNEVE